MTVQFKKATKRQKKARIALIGVTGGGKTLSGLNILRGIVGPTGRIAVIDTEHGSASLYSDRHDFDVLELESFAPERYVEAIRAAATAGFDGLLIDSWSHAWAGKDGVLQFVDEAAKRHRGSSFNAWGDATPKQLDMVEAILSAPLHVVVTMRAKMAYVQEKDERTGKTSIRKVGMQPVQRDGVEYEFDVIGDMTLDNELIVTKTRYSALAAKVFRQPGPELGEQIAAWLADGAAPEPVAPKPEPTSAAADTPKPAAHANGGFINEAQRRNLESIAHANGHDHDGLKQWLAINHGIESTTEIPAAMFVMVAKRLSDKTPLTEVA